MKKLKKLMMTIAVVVVLMGISDKASAGSWGSVLGNSRRSPGGSFVRLGRPSYGGWSSVLGKNRRSPGGSFGRLGRPSYGGWSSVLGSNRYGFGRYGGYGRHDRYRPAHSTFGKTVVYGSLAMDVFQALNQKRLADHQISVDNRMVRIAEIEQDLRLQQLQQLQTKKPKKTQTTQTQGHKNENQELQQDFSKIVSELKAKSPKSYQVYLDQRFADQSQEASLRKALETLKKENKDVYYALLEQMYEN